MVGKLNLSPHKNSPPVRGVRHFLRDRNYKAKLVHADYNLPASFSSCNGKVWLSYFNPVLLINVQKCSVDRTCRHIPAHIEKLQQHNADQDVAFKIASAES